MSKRHRRQQTAHLLQRRLLGRYRYVRLQWRLLCAAIDAVGYLLLALLRAAISLAECLKGTGAGALRGTRPAAIDPDRVRRLLVVQLDHLGDAVISTVMFPLLHRAFPRARIHVLACPANRQVFESLDEVARVHVFQHYRFDRGAGGGWVRGVFAWGRTLRRERFDLAVDVRGDLPIAFLLWLSGAPYRVGWTCGGGGFLLTHTPPWAPGRSEVQSRLALLGALGIEPVGPLPAPAFPVRAGHRRWAAGCWEQAELAGWLHAQSAPEEPPSPRAAACWSESKGVDVAVPQLPFGARHDGRSSVFPACAEEDAAAVRSAGPRIVVHVGAGTAAKRWPVGHWQRLVYLLRTGVGAQVALVGTSDEFSLAESIAQYQPLRGRRTADQRDRLPGAVFNWAGRFSIAELAAVIQQADLFIGADSGPAHLAAAVGTAVAVLFSGAVEVEQWRPHGDCVLLLHAKVPCSPCYRAVCARPGHECMSRLAPPEVFAALAKFCAWHQRRRQPPPKQPVLAGQLHCRPCLSDGSCSALAEEHT